MTESHVQPLYDAQGKLLGVWLSPALWDMTKASLSPILDRALDRLDPQRLAPAPEPLKDWETLKQYWDFSYPLPVDVSCPNCGNATSDWQADEPRKFRLRSATLAGLVNFECQSCRARIIKKHFKRHVDVECRPYVEK